MGRLTGLPIALFEFASKMADLVAAHSAGISGVNIKLSRVEGLTKARMLHDAAVALDMTANVDDI